MESNQSRIEEVASDNIVERKVQPPKPRKRKKKMSFAAWWALHGSEEPKMSTENMEQQDSSLVIDNGSSANAPQKVDQKGDGQEPQSESNENHQVAFETCSEEDIATNQEISAGNIKKQKDSLACVEEYIAGEQEKVDTTEKEQPAKSEEQPPKQREERDELASMEKESSKNTVISAPEPVNEKKSVTEKPKKVNQSKTRRIKKTPLLWKTFPETDACIDLTFFTQNSEIDDGPLPKNQNYQGAFSSSGKKSLWKMLPKSEPCIDVSFFAENTETKNVSMPAEEHDEVASLEKDSHSKNTATQLVTKSILKPQKTPDEKGEKHPSLGKPMDDIQTGHLTEVPVNQTEENVKGEGLIEIQDLIHSTEKKSQVKCMCEAKCKECELEHIKVQKYLMQQLDDMFNVNHQLNAELKQLQDLTRKLLSERRQRKKTMVSVHTQSESQGTSPVYQCLSVQTEMDATESRCHLKQIRQSTSTQTEMDLLENRGHLESVYKTISTQTELFLLLRKQSTETKMNGHQHRQNKVFKRSTDENSRESKTRDASELKAVSDENVSGDIEKEVSVPEMVGDQRESIKNEIHTTEAAIGEVLQVETVSMEHQNGDHQVDKKRSKNSKRKIRRKAAVRDATELKAANDENISTDSIEKEVSVPEFDGDQREVIKNEIHTTEKAIGEVLQVVEEETVSMAQQNGDHQVEKKRSKKSKRKIRRKAAVRDASELESLCMENVSSDNIEKEVSVPEMVGDQRESIENEIHTTETAIGEVLQVETVSMEHQNGDQQVKKKRSKKSKPKMKRKAATRDATELDSLCMENVSGTNTEQEVSTTETTGDQTVLLKTEIHTIETEISKEQQVPEERTELEAAVNPIETEQHLVDITKTTSPDPEKLPDIPQIAPEPAETTVGTVSEDVACKVEAVSTEEECGPMEDQTTSLPQPKVTLNIDEVQTPPQELEPQAAGESAENNISEEEKPKKKKSLWKRIKKALTPPPLRQIKCRCKVHPDIN